VGHALELAATTEIAGQVTLERGNDCRRGRDDGGRNDVHAVIDAPLRKHINRWRAG